MARIFYKLSALTVLGVCLVFSSCDSQKKYASYQETVATILSKNEHTSGLAIAGTALALENVSFNDYRYTLTDYAFTIKKPLTENPADTIGGIKYSDYTIRGKASWLMVPGEKYIVTYDPRKFDNRHHEIVYERPVFLEDEPTIAITGKIDSVDIPANGVIFKYCIAISGKDSCFTKFQWLPSQIKTDSLKKNLSAGYKVLYSPENPARSIIYIRN